MHGKLQGMVVMQVPKAALSWPTLKGLSPYPGLSDRSVLEDSFVPCPNGSTLVVTQVHNPVGLIQVWGVSDGP